MATKAGKFILRPSFPDLRAGRAKGRLNQLSILIWPRLDRDISTCAREEIPDLAPLPAEYVPALPIDEQV